MNNVSTILPIRFNPYIVTPTVENPVVKNMEKHRETCLKNRRKRKQKKR